MSRHQILRMDKVSPFTAELRLAPESRWPLRLDRRTAEEVLATPLPRSCRSDVRQTRFAPALSIVVVTFNNLLFNRMCLESVLADATLENYEIVAVDNGSSDGTVDYLRELSELNPRVRVLLNEYNRGFAAACNQGLAAAYGKFLLLLNNDTIVPAESLGRLIGRLDDPSVGMVGPVTNRCGNEAQIETAYETWGDLMEFAQHRVHSHRHREFEIPMLAMYCVAFRRDVYEQIGALDERFETGLFEDEDYCTRLDLAGYRLVCMEDVFIHHFGQASIGKLASSGEYGDLFHRNRMKFESKWGRKWRPHRQRTTSEYQTLVSQVRQAVELTTPVDSTVLVVSKGDEDLLTLAGRMAWHFPMTDDGRYAGHHPGNSSEAIGLLERLREKGGQFLVIPAPMFWWLEYYAEFAAHLARHYSCTEREGICLVYRLTGDSTNERDSGLSFCSGTWGMSRLTRRLVTVVCPVRGDPRQTVDLVNRLPDPCRFPYRVVMVCAGDADKQTRNQLDAIVARHEHVALASAAGPLSAVAAANVGLRLAPGDVVLIDPSDGACGRDLETVCARAESLERAATVSVLSENSQESCCFVRRTALRRLGLLDERKRNDLAGAWEEFSARAEHVGYTTVRAPRDKTSCRNETDRSAILVVSHDGTGGACMAAAELVRTASAQSRCLLLKAALSSWSLYDAADQELELVGHYRFSNEWRLDGCPGKERESVLVEICERFAVSLVNIHHLLCTGPWIIGLLKRMDVPVVVTFHDFYAICPTVHLIDNEGRFCGGTCSPGSGFCPVDKNLIKEPVPRLKHEYVDTHRHAMNRALAQADAFTAPTNVTRTRLLNALEGLQADDIHLIELGCDVERQDLAVEPPTGGPVKILCPGNLNEAKGVSLLHELMRRDADAGHRFEFHFLGRQPRAFDPQSLGGICHGAYQRADFMDHVARIGPSFSLIASICEETYSYTLSESWAAGLPVFASDRGALKERIGRHDGGWLFNPDSASDFYLGMRSAVETPGPWRKQVETIRGIPLPSARQWMESMLDLFQRCSRRAAVTRSLESAR